MPAGSWFATLPTFATAAGAGLTPALVFIPAGHLTCLDYSPRSGRLRGWREHVLVGFLLDTRFIPVHGLRFSYRRAARPGRLRTTRVLVRGFVPCIHTAITDMRFLLRQLPTTLRPDAYPGYLAGFFWTVRGYLRRVRTPGYSYHFCPHFYRMDCGKTRVGLTWHSCTTVAHNCAHYLNYLIRTLPTVRAGGGLGSPGLQRRALV